MKRFLADKSAQSPTCNFNYLPQEILGGTKRSMKTKVESEFKKRELFSPAHFPQFFVYLKMTINKYMHQFA